LLFARDVSIENIGAGGGVDRVGRSRRDVLLEVGD